MPGRQHFVPAHLHGILSTKMPEWDFDEYDFRFEGLDSPERLERIRTLLLKEAGAFTEIQPGSLLDILQGKGHAYIVGLKNAEEARALGLHLALIATEWNLPAPELVRASEGPRFSCCFFILPEKANPDEKGFRRNLFPADRLIEIRRVLISSKATRTFVYGQWINEAGELIEDYSELYLLVGSPDRNKVFLQNFIEHEIFDRGVECDQALIYLSAKGKGYLIREVD